MSGMLVTIQTINEELSNKDLERFKYEIDGVDLKQLSRKELEYTRRAFEDLMLLRESVAGIPRSNHMGEWAKQVVLDPKTPLIMKMKIKKKYQYEIDKALNPPPTDPSWKYYHTMWKTCEYLLDTDSIKELV